MGRVNKNINMILQAEDAVDNNNGVFGFFISGKASKKIARGGSVL